MMVKNMKIPTATLFAALLSTLLSPSPAQDVRAVDHYISDTAPVAGIGVGEVVPARVNSPQWTSNSRTPDVPSRNSYSSSHNAPHISKETEHTISYVEDVLAGRADVSKGIQDSVFESDGRGADERPRPVTSTGYSRVDAPLRDPAVAGGQGTRGGVPRDVPTTYSRVDHGDSGTPRRPDEDQRTHASGSPREPARHSGTGYSREDSRPVVTPSRVVPVESGRPGGSVRGDDGSGVHRESDRNSASGIHRDSVTSGGGSPRDGRPITQYDDGNSRGGALSGSPRNSVAGLPRGDHRDVAVGNGSPREDRPITQYDDGNSRGTLSGSPRNSVAGLPRGDHRDAVVGGGSPREDRPITQYDDGNSRGTFSGSPLEGDRGSSSSLPGRDTQGGRFPAVAAAGDTRGHPREEQGSVYSREESVAGVASGEQRPYRGNGREGVTRDNAADNSRVAAPGPPRDSTVVDRPRDGAFDGSRGAAGEHSRGDAYDDTRLDSDEYSRDRVPDHSHGSASDDSRRAAAGHSQGGAVPGHSRETVVGRPQDSEPDYPREADDSRDTMGVSYKATTASYHREPPTGNSWDAYESNGEKSERDSVLARPQDYPVDVPDEEPIYTSKELDSEAEDEEDIEVAHSTRAVPKLQKPRQVAAVPVRRGARGPHPASPCPSVFSYEGTRAGRERWYGVVLVLTDVTLTGLRLEIRLDKRADLLGTWLGEVSSVDNIRYTIWNGRRKVVPGPALPVKIFVKYNEEEYDPPRVRTIRLNGRQICPEVKGTPVTPMPPIKPPPRPTQPVTRPVQRPSRPGNAGVQNPNRPQGSVRPQQKPVHPVASGQTTVATELVDGVACGRIDVQASPLITYGQRTARGQWPWHAAIYQSKGTDLNYICGGSLIGKRTILTAAHCVSRRYIDRPIDPESLVVYLGKYHLKLWSEGGVQDKQVLEIHVHPEYNSTNFRADIAILILSSAVEFTVYVKPVCLWDKNRPHLNAVEGKDGVVVGWGYDERGMVTEDLMMAKMPVVSQETCILSYPQFFSHFTSDKTFCAGFRNGTSVCNGDSGGGMVFPKSTGLGPVGKTITWALRGIVSLSTSQENKRVCNTDHYVVFTDIVKFYEWMKKYH